MRFCTTPVVTSHEPRQRSRWRGAIRRGICALVVIPVMGVSLHAHSAHGPKEPSHLIPAPRHASAAMLSDQPRAGGERPSRRDAERTNRQLVANQTRSVGSADAGVSSASPRFARFESGLVGHGPGGVLHLKLPGAESSDPHRLTKKRARLVIEAVVRSSAIRRGREVSSTRSAKSRGRGPLRSEELPKESSAQERAAGSVQNAEELEGASHMELHWSADDLGLSTFVGGSRAGSTACATAFGREIAAEVGLQFLDSESRAYRVMVAQSFKNELGAPVEEARFQFEWNVRF